MMNDVVIEPMTEDFILWRCLHSGPLSLQNIDQWPTDSEIAWSRYHERNLPLLLKLTRTYGACAIVARHQEQIVGMLRFYPKVVCRMEQAGWLCLQQDYPAGPDENFVNNDFPGFAQIEDKTLFIHCLMTGSSRQKENPFQRKGIASHMVRTLIRWAKANDWQAIKADAFEDLSLIYEITGDAGHTFWEKLGFRCVERHPHPHLQNGGEFVEKLEAQARVAGIPLDRAKDRLIMRLDLWS